jgi:hypothetical protein
VGGSDDAVIGWIREIVLNASDPWCLAAFWAGLLGGTPVEWYPGWVTLEPPPHGQRLSFQGTGDGGGLAPGVHFCTHREPGRAVSPRGRRPGNSLRPASDQCSRSGSWRPGAGRQDGQMQRHERFFKFGKSVSTARADHGSHQFDRGTGEGEIRPGRDGWPFRVMLSGTLVPFLVQISEQSGTGIEPVHRTRARRRHVDIEDPCERRLAGEKREVRPARDPEYLLVAGLGG